MTSLIEAADTVLVDCLALQGGEGLLVVSDPPKLSIAQALVQRGREVGAETVWAEMSPRGTNGEEPPASIAQAMLAADVVVAPTTMSLSHTEARHAASKDGVRIATMPDVTEDILTRMMGVDYEQLRARSRKLAEELSNANSVHVTTEAGTDVTLSIEGRQGQSDDGDITRPGAFGNLPAGEAFAAPVEGETRGTIVFDGTIWPLGRLEHPLTIEIRDGFAEDITGPGAEDFMAKLEPYGRDAFAVAELGIGTNEAAKLGGSVLEDEKILGTIHVAFGDNHSFGGNIRVSSHQDGIVLKPTVDIGDQRVLEGGRLLV